MKFTFRFKKTKKRAVATVMAAVMLGVSLSLQGVSDALLAAQPEALVVQPSVARAETAAPEAAAKLPEEVTETPTEKSEAQPAEEPQAEPVQAEAAAPASAPASAPVSTTAKPAAAKPAAAKPAAKKTGILQTATAALLREDAEKGHSLSMTNGMDVELTLDEDPLMAEQELLREKLLSGELNMEELRRTLQGESGSELVVVDENDLKRLEELISGPLTVAETQSSDEGTVLSAENCLAWIYNTFFTKSGWVKGLLGQKYYYDPVTHKAVVGVRVIDGRIYYFNKHGVMKNAVFGVDVSRFQTNVNWQVLKEAGVEYAIIRIGYRGNESGLLVQDSMFEQHLAGASAAGLRTGVYFFTQAISTEEAVEEANAVLAALNGRKLDYPIYIDSEYANERHTGRADGLSVKDRTEFVKAFCKTIEANGYEAGVYASKFWFENRLELSKLKKYSIWNAQWGVAKSGIRCDMWQATASGSIPGGGNGIDINISYMD